MFWRKRKVVNEEKQIEHDKKALTTIKLIVENVLKDGYCLFLGDIKYKQSFYLNKTQIILLKQLYDERKIKKKKNKCLKYALAFCNNEHYEYYIFFYKEENAIKGARLLAELSVQLSKQ